MGFSRYILAAALSFTLSATLQAQSGAGVRAAIRAERAAEAERRMAAQIERLRRMTPVQREKVLSQMMPDRRQRIEARLSALGQMDDAGVAKLGRRLQSFREMPAQDQARMRELAKELNSLDQPRRQALRRELVRLRVLNEADRKARMANPVFQRQFSPDERSLLERLSGLELPEE